jgi:hypothetical protein
LHKIHRRWQKMIRWCFNNNGGDDKCCSR